jgi:protein-arginine kinase activator protein McsA
MQLEKAIQTEEFEEAAKLRDKIRDIENKRAKEE